MELTDFVISKLIEHPALRTDEVRIATVREIKRLGNYSYDLVLGERRYSFLGEKNEKWITRLKEGDKVILITNGKDVKMLYGPIDGSRLNLSSHFF